MKFWFPWEKLGRQTGVKVLRSASSDSSSRARSFTAIESVFIFTSRKMKIFTDDAIIHIVLVNYGPGHTESLLPENCLSRLIVVVISEDHLNPASLGTMRSSQHKLGRGLKIEIES